MSPCPICGASPAHHADMADPAVTLRVRLEDAWPLWAAEVARLEQQLQREKARRLQARASLLDAALALEETP